MRKMMKMMQRSLVFIALSMLIVLSGCYTKQPVSAKIDCQKPCALNVPKIIFAETEHDFGKIPGGAKQSCAFEFINDGGKDLVIEKIHTSCGCTTTTAANTTIKPSQASEIEVTYQAPSYGGKSKKQITVYTNDPQTPQITLWISAEVSGPPQNTTTTTHKPASTSESQRQQAQDTMSPQLKQALRNLNKATGG